MVAFHPLLPGSVLDHEPEMLQLLQRNPAPPCATKIQLHLLALHLCDRGNAESWVVHLRARDEVVHALDVSERVLRRRCHRFAPTVLEESRSTAPAR